MPDALSTVAVATLLAHEVRSRLTQRPHLVVGIDGFSASGKSTLARTLYQALADDAAVLPIPLDHFHHPPEVRYRQGRDSLQGYVEDSFDLDTLTRDVLVPFHAGSDTIHWHPRNLGRPAQSGPARWDRPDDQPAVLLLEGVMLLRPPVVPLIDLRIIIEAPESLLLRRGVARDAPSENPKKAVHTAYSTRYLPGQRRYVTHHSPRATAHILLHAHENDTWHLERP